MIAINDLRVGNCITDENGFEMQVITVGKDYVYCDFEGNEGDLWEFDYPKYPCYGIPLQPEHAKTYDHLKVIQVNEDFFASFGRLKIQIKYYHELQNFHYLINGYEL